MVVRESRVSSRSGIPLLFAEGNCVSEATGRLHGRDPSMKAIAPFATRPLLDDEMGWLVVDERFLFAIKLQKYAMARAVSDMATPSRQQHHILPHRLCICLRRHLYLHSIHTARKVASEGSTRVVAKERKLQPLHWAASTGGTHRDFSCGILILVGFAV